MSEYEKLNKKQIQDIQSKVNLSSEKLEEIVYEIVSPYSSDLDRYVDFIREILKDGENPPTAYELDDFCLNLSVYLYYASSMQEQLGIRDDISRALYKEIYNSYRQSQEKGTVADKDAIAELASQQEYLTSVCYKRAYSIMKAKVSAGQELLSSIKKIISRRMSENELTNLGGNR
jgi:hypothetical protein